MAYGPTAIPVRTDKPINPVVSHQTE